MPIWATILAGALVAAVPQGATRPSSAPRPRGLEIDPSERPEVVGWWWDEFGLLEINDDRTYVRWKGFNRHRAPIETGNYDRSSYNTLWLDPTDAPAKDRLRVQIRRMNSQLRLDLLAGNDPMRPLSAPPITLEDRLVGRWIAAHRELTLLENGSYRSQPVSSDPAADAPVVVSAVSGTWGVRGAELFLAPAAGTEPPERLQLAFALPAAVPAGTAPTTPVAPQAPTAPAPIEPPPPADESRIVARLTDAEGALLPHRPEPAP